MTAARRPSLRRRPLARRLIFWTIVFSGTLALVITVIQLLVEYRRDVGIVEQRFALVQQGYMSSITDTVWVADRDHLNTLLDGIVSLPDFSYAEVRAEGKVLTARGNGNASDGISRTWPLIHPYRGRDFLIGELTIKADLASARERFMERAVFIILANTVKTALVAVFMLLLVDRLVTRHLERIADYLSRLAPHRLATPLMLKRRPRDDELDRVVSTLNRLGADIDAYQAEIRELNASLEQRVALRTAELEAANKELEAFSYSVSHDLQAPLRAISGFCRVLIEDESGNLSPQGRESLERVVNSASKMSRLIQDILEYSRAARLPLERQEVDLAALAHDIAAELAAGYPNCTVNVAPLPPAIGDATMLRQVLQNLIGNALKYSAKSPHPEIRVGCRAEDGHTVYFVSDNGVGFDMQYAGNLFGIFQRLHDESEFRGTGVGLAIVKRLVERHGGRVWAKATPGGGATFSFTLQADALPTAG